MKPILKALFLILIITGQFNNAKSQMYYMPDSMLKVKLINLGYGSCISGDSIDASCSAISAVTYLDISSYNIHSTQGIEAFPVLNKLICNYNSILVIPALPATLDTLLASFCGTPSLPQLPAAMLYLDVTYDSLTVLPSLPPTLRFLICNNNKLTNLPSLPDTLMYLDCASNNISNLPILPDSLRHLDFSLTKVNTMPALPDSLDWLAFAQDSISSFPVCPPKLRILFANNNLLSSLPPLPNTLEWLVSCYNPLTTFPSTLSPVLRMLDCRENNVSTLPSLPSSLNSLWCDNNNLNVLPTLSPNLRSLYCRNTNLTTLPALPNSLKELYCSANQLTSIPALPVTMNKFGCDSNLISNLPELPDSLFHMDISSNPITCLPLLKKIGSFYFQNCPIVCLPNYGTVSWSTPLLSSIPLCDPLNANGCSFFWNISGKTFFDSDSNCTQTVSETGLQYMHLKLYDNNSLVQQVYTGGEGLYSFDVNSMSQYRTELDTINIPFNPICPVSSQYLDTISPGDSLVYNNDFALKCKNGFDIGAWSVLTTPLRPSHRSDVYIKAGDLATFYGIHCAAGVSGTITVNINGNAHYISPLPGALIPTSAINNTVIYTIADFGTLNSNSAFGFEIETDTSAISGSLICMDIMVSTPAGDYNPANNFLSQCFLVQASFDPNIKEVYPEGVIDTSQHWLTFTIHFQNTGTASADNIYILDTLDYYLDVSTFQLLSTSHNAFIQILDGAILKVNFPQINLPDSFANERQSHGYVQYKIKIKDGTWVGTQIRNRANIYFDFNQPVVTNTTLNTISLVSGISNIYADKLIKVFPIPFRDEFIIEGPIVNSTITISELTGKIIYKSTANNTSNLIKLESVENGVYILRIADGTGDVIRKLIKSE